MPVNQILPMEINANFFQLNTQIYKMPKNLQICCMVNIYTLKGRMDNCWDFLFIVVEWGKRKAVKLWFGFFWEFLILKIIFVGLCSSSSLGTKCLYWRFANFVIVFTSVLSIYSPKKNQFFDYTEKNF